MAKKPTRAEKLGCPPGFYKTAMGKCLSPELKKMEKKMDELEHTAEDLEKTFEGFKNMAMTSGDRIPFRGKQGGFKTINQLLEENIEDLRRIKRWLLW